MLFLRSPSSCTRTTTMRMTTTTSTAPLFLFLIIAASALKKIPLMEAAAASRTTTSITIRANNHPKQLIRGGESDTTTRSLQRGRCPENTYTSLFHCQDPYAADAPIGCDEDTCEWNVQAFTATAPPGFCKLIGQIKEAAIYPDILEPCVLWNVLFQVPSVSPSMVPTELPSEAPSTAPSSAPPSPPTAQPSTVPFAVPFDTVIINFFIEQQKAHYDNKDDLTELHKITSQHIQQVVTKSIDLVRSVDIDIDTVSSSTPYANATEVLTLAVSGHVLFGTDYGEPRQSAVNHIVESAFKHHNLRNYLSKLKVSNHPVWESTSKLYVGLPSDLFPTATSSSSGNSDVQNNGTSKTTPSQNDSSKIEWYDVQYWCEWGNWNDMYFIIIVAAGGSAVLLVAIAMLLCCCVCRRRRLRREAFLLAKQQEQQDHDDVAVISPGSTSEDDEELALPTSKVTSSKNNNSGTKSANEAHSLLGPSPFVVVQRSSSNGKSASNNNINDEASSFYSYIDSKSVLSDDIGALSDYDANIPGDQSGLWSMADGMVEQPLSSKPNTYRSTTNTNIKATALGNDTASSDNDDEGLVVASNHSPSDPMMILTTASSSDEKKDMLIFSDENAEDDVSMLSAVNTTAEYGGGGGSEDVDIKGGMAAATAAFAAGQTLLAGSFAKDSPNKEKKFTSSAVDKKDSSPPPPVSTPTRVIVDDDKNEKAKSITAINETSLSAVPPVSPESVASSKSKQSAAASFGSLTNNRDDSSKPVSPSTSPDKMSTSRVVSDDGSKSDGSNEENQPEEAPVLKNISSSSTSTASSGGDDDDDNGNHTTMKPSLIQQRDRSTSEDSSRKSTTQASYIMRASSFKSWGLQVNKTGATTDAEAADGAQKGLYSCNLATRKKAFGFTRAAAAASRASQLALGSEEQQSDDQSVGLYQESESDIQSICSKDDYSFLRSPGTADKYDEFKVAHLPTGAALMLDNDESLLGGQDSTIAQSDEDEESSAGYPLACNTTGGDGEGNSSPSGVPIHFL